MDPAIFSSFEPILIVVVMTLVGATGIAVFNADRKSATNRSFFFLSLVTIVYAVTNYLGLLPGGIDHPETTLWLLRATIFFAVLHSYSIFHLFYVFPDSARRLPHWYHYALLPWVTCVLLLTLSPFVFASIRTFSPDGVVLEIENGPLIGVFGLTVIALVAASFLIGIAKARRALGLARIQIAYLLVGATITYSLLILFNFIYPTVLGDSSLVPFAPLFIVPFIASTAYAIYRHQLFDVKLVTTQAFVVILCIFLFSRIFIAGDLGERLVDSTIFVAAVFFGILLIRSVQKEIQQREEIAKLASELAKTNWELAKKNEELRIIDQRKSEFVSIVSHQLRTPITAIKGYASLLLENAYGTLAKEFAEPVEKIYASSKRLAEMVSDFLDISKIEQGTMTYRFAPVDIRALLEDLVKEFRTEAEKKKLSLEFRSPKNEEFFSVADEGKMRQIFSNLLDNAIKYTPKGRIDVALAKNDVTGTLAVEVKDTGIGLSQDDIHHLFGKFTRGEGGQRENTDGSGLGLYVAKKMLEAHRGKIWVDSEGPGRGSIFVVELPLKE